MYASQIISDGPQSRICSSHLNGNESKVLLEGERLPSPLSPLPTTPALLQLWCLNSAELPRFAELAEADQGFLFSFLIIYWVERVNRGIGRIFCQCQEKGERRERRMLLSFLQCEKECGHETWKALRPVPTTWDPLSSLQRRVPGTRMCIQHSTIKQRFTRNLHWVW